MSHVDDGTLHAYLDGELSPAEAQGIDAHLAQCPACRGRLEEERALITRAGELLALAAPPDRELPPFRAGDVKPPAGLWWRVRLPLAWAATVVLALGIGTYLGSGSAYTERSAPALAPLNAPVATPENQSGDLAAADTAARRMPQQSRVAARVAKRAVAPAPAARHEAVAGITRDRALSPANPAPVPVPAPQVGLGIIDGARRAEEGSTFSLDSARVLLGADPLVVPGAPIRAIRRAHEIGYSAVVIVEQALDSNTVIAVVSGRRSPVALGEVVVTGAAAMAARPDSASAAERERVDRARVADSLGAAPAAKASARLMRDETRNRPPRRVGNLEIRISGPLPADSLQQLLQLVQPVKP